MKINAFNKPSFQFGKKIGNNTNVQQNIQNTLNNINNFVLDSYENIKSKQSLSNRDCKNLILLNYLKDSKPFQDIYNKNDFINSYYFINIENKEKNTSINLLLPKNKINGKNVNLKELILKEMKNIHKSLILEIEKSLKLKLIKDNYTLQENNIGNNQHYDIKYQQ